ncbi:MAG TPA: PTS lactose/cellobiose transporter subunit IIA [Symbiobacteriaceae bacterium]|nr:PTS lactose/cellobiose transporter subunit IIA [Symbiobacteriaceae bacterium]
MVDLEQSTMQLIIHSGNARSLAYEAFDLALAGDFAAAGEKLREASAEISRAHAQQTALIQNEAAGKGVPITLLLVHGQDHLMASMTELNLIERLVKMLELRK